MAPILCFPDTLFVARLPRRTARLRLTLFYGGLFLVSGVVLLAITNLLVRSKTGNFVFLRDVRKRAAEGKKRPPNGRAIFNYRSHLVPNTSWPRHRKRSRSPSAPTSLTCTNCLSSPASPSPS